MIKKSTNRIEIGYKVARIIVCFLLAQFLIPGCSFWIHETYCLSGRVLDKRGNGMEGITVYLQERGTSTLTNEDGNWTFSGLSQPVTIQVKQQGWSFSPARQKADRSAEKLIFEGNKQALSFEDPNLEAAIRQRIGVPDGPIPKSEVTSVQALTANYENIRSLDGIEELASLRRIVLKGNQIQEVSPLSKLSNLRHVNLRGNELENLRWTQSLTQLRHLNVSENNIQTVRPLSNISGLHILRAKGNQISSLKPLSNLDQLVHLELSDNELETIQSMNQFQSLEYVSVAGNPAVTKLSTVEQSREVMEKLSNRGCTVQPKLISFRSDRLEAIIRDELNQQSGILTHSDLTSITSLDASNEELERIQGIQHLSNLRTLDLSGNQIRDVSPLSKLEKLRFLDLRNNRISSIQELLPKALDPLVFQGSFMINKPWNVIPSSTFFSQGTTLSYSSMSTAGPTDLRTLNLGQNPLRSLKGIDRLQQLKRLYLDRTKLTSLRELRKISNVTYLNLAGYSTKEVQAQLPDQLLSGPDDTNPVVVSGRHIQWKDHRLRKGIRSEISTRNGVSPPLTPRNVADIRTLDLSDSGISSIQGLQYFTGLRKLKLQNNRISNLEPLSGLTQLEVLDLSNNQIEDITPLTRLRSLTDLRANYNEISHLHPLSSLRSLSRLELAFNAVSSIQPISEITELTYLGLGANDLTSIQPLSRLSNLQQLHLWGNDIRSVRPLRSLKRLRILNLNQNYIESIQPLTNLTQLKELYINKNWIRSIQSLLELPRIQKISITGNKFKKSNKEIKRNIRKLRRKGVKLEH